MRVTDFPDNSVVCHAHHQTEASRDVFVSGSVPAVNSMRHLSRGEVVTTQLLALVRTAEALASGCE